jgi:L-methionine (R)-S-oxide reductase
MAAAKRATYAKLAADLEGFFARYPGVDTCGRMATLNSFLHDAFPHWVFIGFYTVKEPGKLLQIGPYQGHVLATALIPFGAGVCGTAAATLETQVVDDVTTCNNYIPCDDATRSEIVVPVFGYNYHSEPEAPAAARGSGARKLIAVLDIDTGEVGGFDGVDKEALEALLARYFL